MGWFKRFQRKQNITMPDKCVAANCRNVVDLLLDVYFCTTYISLVIKRRFRFFRFLGNRFKHQTAFQEFNMFIYNPPINFRVILLATLRHVV